MNQKHAKQPKQHPILTAAAYRNRITQKNSQPTTDQIYQSLLTYQKQIKISEGTIKLMKYKQKILKLRHAFDCLKKYQRLQLNQEQEVYIDAGIISNCQDEQQLCYIIQNRIQNQQLEQKMFIEELKQQYYEQQQNILQSTIGLVDQLRIKVNRQLKYSFNLLKQVNKYTLHERVQNPVIKRSLIKNMVTSLNSKIVKQKYDAFKNITQTIRKQKTLLTTPSKLNLIQKGRKLLQLNYFPQYNVKRALWRWFLNTSDLGNQIFVQAANNLVLYTNVNKITAFYRLFGQIRQGKKRIPPRVKRMAIFIHLFSKVYFDRLKKDAFNFVKQKSQTSKNNFAYRVIRMAQLRTKIALNIWYKNTFQNKIQQDLQRQKANQQKRLRQIQKRKKLYLYKIIEYSNRRKRDALRLWLKNSIQKKNNDTMLIKILKKMMCTKAGLIKQALGKIKSIPDNKSLRKWNLKANQFEIGLSQFVNKVLKQSFMSFRDEYDRAQNIKKGAAAKLLNSVMLKQKRMYNRWGKMVEMNRMAVRCREVALVMEKVNMAIKSVADNVFLHNRQNQAKQKAISQLFSVFNDGLRNTFNKWRQVNKIEKLKAKMGTQNRRIILKMLENLLHKGRHRQIRDVVSKFNKNRKIANIQRNFMKRMLESKAGMVMVAFKKIQNLRNMKIQSKGNLFEKGLSNFVNRVLRASFQSFRDDYERAQNLKKAAVVQMMSTTMSGRKKMYNRWKVLTDQTRLIEKCRRLPLVFGQINSVIKSVADNALLQKSSNSAKQKAISQLFSVFNDGLRNTFNKWRQVNKIQKFKLRASVQNRRFIIKMLENLLHNGRHQQIRDVISKFNKNRKIANIQRNFMKRMLESKAGMVMVAFKKIQNLRNMKIQSKGNLFEKGLSNFVNRVLRASFESFRDDYERAQNLKKAAVVQMMNTTMSGRKKMYNRWKVLTEQTRLMEKCKRLPLVFGQISSAIKSVADNALYVDRQQSMKRKLVLQKLITQAGDALRETFERWREINRVQKYNQWYGQSHSQKAIRSLEQIARFHMQNHIRKSIEKFVDNRRIQILKCKYLKKVQDARIESVRMAFKKIYNLQDIKSRNSQKPFNQSDKLRMITAVKLIERSIHRKRDALLIWRSHCLDNRKSGDIVSRILTKMMCTRAGRIKQALGKIKSIPDNKSLRKWNLKANQFEIGLSQFVNKVLKQSFMSFRDEYDRAQNIKKGAAAKLLNSVMLKQKRMYNRWGKMVEMNRMAVRCRRVALVMEKVNMAIKSVADNVFLHNRQNQAKQKAISQLFSVFNDGLRNTFNKWRQVNKIEKLKAKMGTQNRRIILKMLENLLHKGRHRQIRDVVSKFNKNRKIANIQRNFMKRMLESKAGMVMVAFKKIQNLRNMKIQSKGNLFEKGLSNFVNRVLRASFQSFRDDYERAQNLKKAAVVQMMSTTMSGRKKMYNRWKVLTEQTRLMEKCKRLPLVFGQISSAIKSVADNALYVDRQQSMKRKLVLQKLITQAGDALRETFERWREINRVQKYNQWYGQSHSQKAIRSLEQIARFHMQNHIRKSIEKFVDNRRIQILKYKYLKKVQDARIESVRMALRKMQAMRNMKIQSKGNLFEKGLSSFVNRVLRASFESFRDDYERAQNLKKAAVVQMMNTTMSSRKKMYNRWRVLTEKTKLIQITKRVSTVFLSVNQSIKSVTKLAFITDKSSNHRNQGIINMFKLFNKLSNPYQAAFQKMKSNMVQLRLQNLFKNTHVLSRNHLQQILSSLFYKNVKIPTMIQKNYGLDQVQYIIKYILKLFQRHKNNVKSAFKAFQSIPTPSTRVNPWFKKASLILCFNTRINVQKSFWRMGYNSQSTGISFNAAVIVKLKKMYNNIKKAYVLNMYHAFLMIDRTSSLVLKQMQYDQMDNMQSGSPQSKNSYSFIQNNSAEDGQYEGRYSINQQDRYSIKYDKNRNSSRQLHTYAYKNQNQNNSFILPQINAQIQGQLSLQKSKRASVNIMARVFNKFLRKRVHTWAFNIQPMKKYKNILVQSNNQNLQIARLGAVQAISKINNKITILVKQKCLDRIICKAQQNQIYQHREQNVKQMTDSLARHQLLIQQIRFYREQYEGACQQLQQKQNALRQAQNMITVLSLRNNYIITHKFLVSIQQVFYGVIERNLDEAFDAIMEQANRSYQVNEKPQPRVPQNSLNLAFKGQERIQQNYYYENSYRSSDRKSRQSK